jgi:diphthine synthase
MAEVTDNNQKTGLLLIGIGPGDVALATSEALEAAKMADYRRYEAYTALWPEEQLANLEKAVGKITRVMRPEVESPDELFALARDNLVALLIVGDPLQATTHVDLQLQAEEAGIYCRTIHGISITGLVTGAIGLSNYKFGRQTTLTYPYSGWIATSPLEVIALNTALGQHTLALLDLDPTGAGTGQQKPMKPNDAVNSIKAMIDKVTDSIDEFPLESPQDTIKVQSLKFMTSTPLVEIKVVLCSDMGTKQQSIIYTNLANLATLPGGEMNCLVFPASTSDVEEKALLRWLKEE